MRAYDIIHAIQKSTNGVTVKVIDNALCFQNNNTNRVISINTTNEYEFSLPFSTFLIILGFFIWLVGNSV